MRKSLRRSWLVLIAVFSLATGASQAADRPNFVWLVSEDNSKHWLRLYDATGAETPRIEALAREGLVFEHAFSNAPVCSVARTTLITSCYAPRIGTQFHRKFVSVPLPPGLRMFPAYLRDAGYYTTNLQKKDYNAIEGPGVWDVSSRRASWRRRKDGQPFFHMQSFGASHESSLHFPPSALESEPTSTDPKSVTLAPYHPDTATFRYTYARYHDRIREIDRQVGAVVDALAEDGLLEDTFIFYFGDHGGVLPRSKGYVYESGLHVPLVVRIPEKWKERVDAERGTRVSGFVSFVDFGPTLLKLAGLELPKGIDGRPFLGEGVSLAEVNRRDEAFGYADRFDEKYDLVRSLRKGRFKYLRSYQPFNVDALQNNYRYKMLAYVEWGDLHRAGKLDAVQRRYFEPRAAEELYDVEADPHETKNLADDPRHADTLRSLRSRLRDIVVGMPDLSFFPESVLVREAFENPTEFGARKRAGISRLVDVLDLQLRPFEDAREGIEEALESSDPWMRYHGWIVCSSHGAAAEVFSERAQRAAREDPERLVRVRAAEFLGLRRVGAPRAALAAALGSATSASEACLILNSCALLHDVIANDAWKFEPKDVSRVARTDGEVQRRLEYLAPQSP